MGDDMATELKPDMEARVSALAERLGFAGPDAAERVIIAALDYLDESTGKWERWYTRAEIDMMVERDRVAYLKEHGYPENDPRPLSQLLQDELYDEFGLPK